MVVVQTDVLMVRSFYRQVFCLNISVFKYRCVSIVTLFHRVFYPLLLAHFPLLVNRKPIYIVSSLWGWTFFILLTWLHAFLLLVRPGVELPDERSQRETSGICSREGDSQHLFSVQRSHGSTLPGSTGHRSLPRLLRPVNWGCCRTA